jgi:hypothetical protein
MRLLCRIWSRKSSRRKQRPIFLAIDRAAAQIQRKVPVRARRRSASGRLVRRCDRCEEGKSASMSGRSGLRYVQRADEESSLGEAGNAQAMLSVPMPRGIGR